MEAQMGGGGGLVKQECVRTVSKAVDIMCRNKDRKETGWRLPELNNVFMGEFSLDIVHSVNNIRGILD